MPSITASVGRSGTNRRPDVKVVQELINKNLKSIPNIKPLVTDSLIGPKTIGAIVEFQRKVVKFTNPDGRVDPNGKTLGALNSGAGKPGKGPGGGNGGGGGGNGDRETVDAPPGLPGWYIVTEGGVKLVTYKHTVPSNRRLVSQYANTIMAEAVSRAGMPGVVITSTMRTSEEQAGIMYDNCAITFRNDGNLAAQYRIYGASGDKVIDVFRDNHVGKSRSEVVRLMHAKVDELQKTNRKVSLHIRTVAAYKNRNIIDIGIGSCERLFGAGNVKVAALCRAFTELRDEGYIAHYVDETKKSNKCWHIEVIPNAKPFS